MSRKFLSMLVFLVFLGALPACGAPQRPPNYQGTRDRSDKAFDDLDRQKDDRSDKPER